MTQQPKQFRFSQEKLAALPIPKDGPATYRDTDIPQLGFRIQPSGKAVFFVLKKVAGKTYRKTLGDFKHLPLAAARKHAHALLAKVADWQAGDRKELNPMLRPLDDTKLTFETAFEMYKKSKRKRVTNKERADERVQYRFDRYLTGIAGRPLDELTMPVIANLHDKLTKDFGPVAANRAHEVVRAVFNFLISKGLWTATNPSKGASPNSEESRTRILEKHEIRPFLDALEAEKNRDFAEFVALLLATGSRKSNLYACEWDELSLPAKTWTIPGEKYKTGKTTTLPLKPQAVALFKMREARPNKDPRWVFPSKTSESGHIMDYKNQFARLKKAAGFKEITVKNRSGKLRKRVDFSFHDLRRSFIAFMVSSGRASMPVISAAAGHSSLESMEPYARYAKDAVTKALDAGEDEMQGQMREAEAEKKREQRRLSA